MVVKEQDSQLKRNPYSNNLEGVFKEYVDLKWSDNNTEGEGTEMSIFVGVGVVD